MVCTLDNDTGLFGIVLKYDAMAPFLFIIYQNCIRRIPVDLMKENGLPLKVAKADDLSPITKTIQVRRTRHAGHCWRSKDELISDVLLWTPAYGWAKAGRPARTYIQQLCEDTGCNPEDLPEAMNDREKWRERVRDIRASGMTWWWWWFHRNYHRCRLSW